MHNSEFILATAATKALGILIDRAKQQPPAVCVQVCDSILEAIPRADADLKSRLLKVLFPIARSWPEQLRLRQDRIITAVMEGLEDRDFDVRTSAVLAVPGILRFGIGDWVQAIIGQLHVIATTLPEDRSPNGLVLCAQALGSICSITGRIQFEQKQPEFVGMCLTIATDILRTGCFAAARVVVTEFSHLNLLDGDFDRTHVPAIGELLIELFMRQWSAVGEDTDAGFDDTLNGIRLWARTFGIDALGPRFTQFLEMLMRVFNSVATHGTCEISLRHKLLPIIASLFGIVGARDPAFALSLVPVVFHCLENPSSTLKSFGMILAPLLLRTESLSAVHRDAPARLMDAMIAFVRVESPVVALAAVRFFVELATPDHPASFEFIRPRLDLVFDAFDTRLLAMDRGTVLNTTMREEIAYAVARFIPCMGDHFPFGRGIPILLQCLPLYTPRYLIQIMTTFGSFWSLLLENDGMALHYVRIVAPMLAMSTAIPEYRALKRAELLTCACGMRAALTKLPQPVEALAEALQNDVYKLQSFQLVYGEQLREYENVMFEANAVDPHDVVLLD
jgi:hypothetical protein